MSVMIPLLANQSNDPQSSESWYGDPNDRRHNIDYYNNGIHDDDNEDAETTKLIVGISDNQHCSLQKSSLTSRSDVGNVIYELFLLPKDPGPVHAHPKTHPKMAPERRFARHRNHYIYQLNQFRHWWKTSRLLVRVSGGYEYCINKVHWIEMGLYNVSRHKQAKKALKSVKGIGRGGPSADFLAVVQPFTRGIRIVLAFARGWEARVDNRFLEVLLAETFAFMGNRCFRWIAREFVIVLSKMIIFPYVGSLLLEPHLEQRSRPLIVSLGFLRAILPFVLSFQGSWFGRQLTYNTYLYSCFRWRPVQNLAHFHQRAGIFRDTVLDAELLAVAHIVAMAGCQQHPAGGATREETLTTLGFSMAGCGQGGYVVYRKLAKDSGKVILVHVTPYGPSILDEMPRYIILERRTLSSSQSFDVNSDLNLLDAAVPPEATIAGFTYSGAFFKSQEWAALTSRFKDTLECYETACRKFGTIDAFTKHNGRDAIRTTPTDLATLKAFVRSGHTPRKIKKDFKLWKQLDAEIKNLSALVAKYQKNGMAPKRIILYLEGLDCSAKSSTGGLIFSALEGCGYTVRTAQHNRPPSEEQRQKPWMDRSRFEHPEDVYGSGEEIPEYTALVWDRGPAGDFVYGNLGGLSDNEKEAKYDEFRSYDTQCRLDGVMFCKLLFIADKDSIASTLGKRLAHKKIARDLRTWLDANTVGQHIEEGLDEIERHIDPTDFVAFNKYQQNLSIFTDFARHTDDIREQITIDGIQPGYHNPWCIVNTAKRHPARLALLQTFERQLERFAKDPKRPVSWRKRLQHRLNVTRPYLRDDAVFHLFLEDKVDAVLSLRAVFQIILLLLLFCFYLFATWKVDFLSLLDEE